MPKIAYRKIFGVLFFKGDHQYTQITTINMCLFPEIRQNTLIQFHRIYIGVKIINLLYLFENDILRNCSHKILGVQRGAFEGLGVQIQVNLDMTDSMGPGKLVRHMQNLSYEYFICIGLGPSISSVICKNLSYSGLSYPSSPVHPDILLAKTTA